MSTSTMYHYKKIERAHSTPRMIYHKIDTCYSQIKSVYIIG